MGNILLYSTQYYQRLCITIKVSQIMVSKVYFIYHPVYDGHREALTPQLRRDASPFLHYT